MAVFSVEAISEITSVNKGLFSADIPEWMKWAFVFLGR